MTISQAIKELKEQKLSLDRHVTRGATYCADYAEALGMAIVALERRVPRALEHYDEKNDSRGFCPRCGWRNSGFDKMCRYCGQIIDPSTSACVSMSCIGCSCNNDKHVCVLYADKVDEIRRIHEEAGNDR